MLKITSLSWLPFIMLVEAVPIYPSQNSVQKHSIEKTLLRENVSFLFCNFMSFNSLSKVLFTFPSRYFYSIGLELIFPIGWNVPPFHTPLQRNANLGRMTLRESEIVYRNIIFSFLLSQGVNLFTLFAIPNTWEKSLFLVDFPVRSPLLKKSLLFLIPPLNDMLKFRG